MAGSAPETQRKTSAAPFVSSTAGVSDTRFVARLWKTTQAPELSIAGLMDPPSAWITGNPTLGADTMFTTNVEELKRKTSKTPFVSEATRLFARLSKATRGLPAARLTTPFRELPLPATVRLPLAWLASKNASVARSQRKTLVCPPKPVPPARISVAVLRKTTNLPSGEITG